MTLNNYCISSQIKTEKEETNLKEDIYYKGIKIFASPGLHGGVIEMVQNFLQPGSKVLELGAGSGAFSLRLKESGFNIIASGIEPDTFSLNEVPYSIIDLNKDIPEEHIGGYDAVVAIEVIEHLENIFDFFRKANLFLKPGGILFLTTPNIFSIRSRLIFFKSGNFLFYNPALVEDWGHIHIIPEWLLQIAAERGGFCCKHVIGMGSQREYLMPIWQKLLVLLGLVIKKAMSKERFSGEFYSANIFFALEKVHN